MAKIKTSKQFAINWMDIAKACLMATLTPVLVLIQNTVDAGVFTFHWKNLLMAAIGGFVAYLIKNFFTPSKIVIKGNDVNEAIDDLK